MALAVNLPSDGGISRADFVVTAGSSCGASVLGDISPHFAVDDHSTHEVRVLVRFVIDNDKGWGLDSSLLRKMREITKEFKVAGNTIVKRSLVLVDSSTMRM
jgi:hypothetical protein